MAKLGKPALHSDSYNLAVQIVRFVDESQPGFVACEFEDATGCRHTIIDKVPIFTITNLHAGSMYPQRGTVRCEVLARWKDRQERELVRVTTLRPDGVESIEGLSEFEVLSTAVSPTENSDRPGS